MLNGIKTTYISDFITKGSLFEWTLVFVLCITVMILWMCYISTYPCLGPRSKAQWEAAEILEHEHAEILEKTSTRKNLDQKNREHLQSLDCGMTINDTWASLI